MQMRESGIRVPLMLMGCAYGFVQAGVKGSLLGIAGGFVVGTFTTNMVAGVAILATGFLALWLQAGGGARVVAFFDPETPAASAPEGVAAHGNAAAPGPGSLAATIDPGRTVFAMCLLNDLPRVVEFEYRWGADGRWTEASLPPGGAGLVHSDSEGQFHTRWPQRIGSPSLRTRWVHAVRITGPVGVEACPELQAMEFRLSNSRVELVRTGDEPRAMVCVINRTGSDLSYAIAWNDGAWSGRVTEVRYRTWFDSEAGSTFRIRLPERVGGPVAEGEVRTLASKDVHQGGECMDGAVYIVRAEDGRLTVTPAG